MNQTFREAYLRASYPVENTEDAANIITMHVSSQALFIPREAGESLEQLKERIFSEAASEICSVHQAAVFLPKNPSFKDVCDTLHRSGIGSPSNSDHAVNALTKARIALGLHRS